MEGKEEKNSIQSNPIQVGKARRKAEVSQWLHSGMRKETERKKENTNLQNVEQADSTRDKNNCGTCSRMITKSTIRQ